MVKKSYPRKIHCVETQILVITPAKNAALDEHGVFRSFDDQEEDLGELGLRPLWVYALVAPAYKQYRRVLVDPLRPLAVSELLHRAWQPDADLGLPLTLQARSQLLASSRGFAQWVQYQQIRVEPVPSVKVLTAFERSSADVAFAAQFDRSRDGSVDLPWSLAAANASLRRYDWEWSHHMSSPSKTSMERLTFSAWQQRARRWCTLAALDDEWDTAALGPYKPPKRPDPELAVHLDDDEPVWHVAGVAQVVEQWPGGGTSLLASLGIRRADFDFWRSGRAHLSDADRLALSDALNIVFLPEYNDWEFDGGNLLVATTTSALEAAYEELTHGGDVEYAFEVLGPSGERPPMRCLLFGACGGLPCVVLFEPGGPGEAALNAKSLMNLDEPQRVTKAVWATVNFIIKNRLDFENPGRVGELFESQHRAWLDTKQRW